jgi:hypothetical protein
LLFSLLVVYQVQAQPQWNQTSYGAFGGRFTAVTSSGANIIVGTPYGVWLSSDNGNSFQPSNTGLTNSTVLTLLSFGGKVFAGTSQGVFISGDNGGTWSQSGLQNGMISLLTLVNSTVIASDYMYTFTTTDLGTTWSQNATEIDENTFGVTGTTVFTANRAGTIFQSVDSGVTWSTLSSIPGNYIYSLAANGNLVVASGTTGTYRSTDGGLTWGYINNMSFNQLTFFNGTFYGQTSANSLVKSTDGLTWVDGGSTFPLVQPAGGSTIYALTPNGISYSTDNAATFTHPLNGGLLSGPVNWIAKNGNTLLAATYPGIKRSSDNGATWSDSNSGLTNPGVTGIILVGNTFVAATFGGGVFISSDDGVSWTASNNSLSNLYVASIGLAGNTILAGTMAGVYISSDLGSTWSSAGLVSDYVQGVSGNNTTLFAAIFAKNVMQSTDNGVTWSTSPSSPSYPNNITTVGNSTFVGTNSGIFFTTDNGGTWTKMSSQFDQSIISALTNNGNDIFFATNNGDIYGGGASSIQLISTYLPTNRSVSSLCADNSQLYAALGSSSGGFGSIWTTSISSILSIDSFTPTFGKVGSTITITGSNFSPVASDNQVQFTAYNSVNNLQQTSIVYGTVLSATSNQITVSVPPSSGANPLNVRVNGQTVSTLQPFTILPEIQVLAPSAGLTYSQLTIIGNGFNCPSISRVSFGEGESAGVISCSSTSVVVNVPEQALSGPVAITDFAQNSYSSPGSFNVIPQVSGFYPSSGLPGSTVTILGTGFDFRTASNNVVKFGGVAGSVSLVAAFDQLYATVPPGANSGVITVEISSNLATSRTLFLVEPLPTGCFSPPPKPTFIVYADSSLVILKSSSSGGNQWFLNGAAIQTATDSTLIVTQSGTYTLSVTVDGCPSPTSDAQTVALPITGDIAIHSWISVFPNPAHSAITLDLSGQQNLDTYSIDIYDVMGINAVHTQGRGGDSGQIDISSLSSGLYVLKVSYSGKVFQTRFIKS